MNYQVIILRSAQKDLAGLARRVAMLQRIARKLRSLAENPRGTDTIKLIAEDSYRTRVGNYQIVYTIDDEARIVTVVHIEHRSDVYSDVYR